MKRTGFKKKTYEEVLKSKKTKTVTKTKKAKPKSTKPLITKLWSLCKEIIRKKYGNVCYTCGKNGLSGSNWHTGHFIPSSTCGAYLRYDLRNLRPQCYSCNINLGGNGAIFYSKLLEKEGKQYVEKIFKDKNISIKADSIWYESKIEEYKKIADSL